MKQNSVPMAQMAGTGSTKVTINDSSKHDDGSPMLEDQGEQRDTAEYHPGMKVVDCSKIIRLGFLRKVYGILSIQLLTTALVCTCAMKMTGQYVGTYETLSMGSFIVSSRAFYIFIFIISFVLLIALLCFKNTYPVNYCLLGAWTLSISFSVATACVVVLCDPMVVTGRQEILPFSLAKDGTPGGLTLFQGSVYCAVGTASEKSGTNSVLLAVAITTAIFLSLTVFTFQSKWDFSFLGAGLGASLWILILWGIGMSLFGGGLGEMRYWYSLFGAIIFSLYIIYDTWKISTVYGPDDYIVGAIDLYLDIINLFLFLLRLLSDRR